MKDQIRNFKNFVINVLSYIQLIPILPRIKKGDVVIDCGANVGVVTGYFASRGARVYSFEPDPNAYKVLSEKFADNPDVECINKGVWTEDSKMKLFFHSEFHGGSSPWSVGSSLIQEKENVNTDNFVEVDLVDLAQFIKDLDSRVKVLKIDIEGAEIDVLNKLIDEEQHEKVDKILVETHETKIPSQRVDLPKLRTRIKDMGIRNINLNWL